jgi:hypothetical protein
MAVDATDDSNRPSATISILDFRFMIAHDSTKGWAEYRRKPGIVA